MEHGKLAKCLSKFVAGIVSAAIAFTLIPKILGNNSVIAEEMYDIWIGDTQITSSNCANVLGEEKGGNPTVAFDPNSNTLTLNDPEIATLYDDGVSKSFIFLGFGFSSSEIIITGSAKFIMSGGDYALLNNSYSYNVILDADIESDLDINVRYLTIDGGKLSADRIYSYELVVNDGDIVTDALGSDYFEMYSGTITTHKFETGDFLMYDGEIDADSLLAYGFVLNDGYIKVNNTINSLNEGAGIFCASPWSMEINGGTVIAEGVNYGIYVSGTVGIGDLEITSGSVTARGSSNYGIHVGNCLDISGGVVDSTGKTIGIYAYKDITISGSTAVVHALANDSSVCFAMVSKSGTISLHDEMDFKDNDDAVAKSYDDGTYTFQNAICDKNSGNALTEIKIMKTICTITWKPGDGTGTAITETVNTGDVVYYKDFPDTWTEPSDGRHFDGWLIEGSTIIPHYEYCSGGWTPGVANMYVYEDITCTAKYKYWITGYEDTGDGGIEGIGDLLRGMKPSGSDNCALEGETVEIEIDLKDGFSIADNKIEVLSAGTGKVITSFTVSYHEMSDSMRGTFTMPGEDVTLRFSTKDNNASSSTTTSSESSTTTTSTVTAANTYTVLKGADGEWDGISDYVIEVKSSSDDEHCIDRFLWAAVDGHELVIGKECLITKGSTIVTIKSDYLKSLGEGTHNVVVNFKDNSVATTLVVKAASTQNAASVPATGEGLAPTLFIGGTFVIAAAGFIGIAIMKKRKES